MMQVRLFFTLAQGALFLYGFIGLALPTLAQEALVEDKPQKEETLITSDQFEMLGRESENYFYFYGNVVITGTNLHATCDEMQIISNRQTGSSGTIGEVSAIQSIIMKKNVILEQSGRVAEAGQADIFPREGKVVLSENPKVKDSEGTVTGYRIILVKDQKKVIVEGDPTGDTQVRPTLTLPGFQDLGYQGFPKSPQSQSREKDAK